MFVGDVNNGNLYRFELNDNSTELILDGLLNDRVVKGSDELPKQMVFGQEFGAITDIEIGPRWIYVHSYT